MPPPLVSIITPSYRSVRFISETIESIMQQDYDCIEHIIIDGNSDDGTLEILKNHHHLIWVSEVDGGQSQALNKGFKIAKGEIIGWLNADDAYTHGAVSRAVGFLNDHPDVDLVYSDQQIIDENGAFMRPSRSRPFDLITLLSENFIRQPTVFFRRKVIDELGGVNEDLHYCMDREFWLRIGVVFKIQYNPDAIGAKFRQWIGTKTYQNKAAFHAEWISVLEKSITDPYYRNIPLDAKLKALQQARVRLHVASMEQAFRTCDPMTFFGQLFIMVTQNWDYILRYPIKRLGRS